MKTIVLFDSNWHGHHPTYLKLTARVLIEQGHRVWLCCQEPGEVRRWLERLFPEKLMKDRLISREAKSYCRKSWFGRKFPFLALWIYTAKQVKAIVKEQGVMPDLVLFMKIDDYVGTIIPPPCMDMLFPFPWAGLFIHLDFRGDGTGRADGRIQLRSQVLRARNCKAVGTLQEQYLQRLEIFTGKKVLRFPDVTDETFHSETALSRDVTEKARGRKIISLLGGLDARKGLTALFNVACQNQHRDWFFLMAGKMPLSHSSEEIRTFRERIAGKEPANCYFHFDILEDGNEMNSLVKISDVLFLVYDAGFAEYSSNVATKAALFSKPILVKSGSLMGKRVEKFGTGICCDRVDTKAIASGIEDLLVREFPSAKYVEYFSAHSQERLRKTINDLIEVTA